MVTKKMFINAKCAARSGFDTWVTNSTYFVANVKIEARHIAKRVNLTGAVMVGAILRKRKWCNANSSI